MNLEELFVAEFEKANKKINELEKSVALLEIGHRRYEQLFKECEWFLSKLTQHGTNGGNLWTGSYLFCDDAKDRAVNLLKQFKIEIKETNDNEVEKR